jgi:uncharacterized membrane protein
MQESVQKSTPQPMHGNPFRIAILSALSLLIVLSLSFRFVNLGLKPFWDDEARAMLWLSGKTEKDLHTKLCRGEISQVSEVQRYQKISRDRGPAETISSLSTTSPQHGPIYYVCAREWAGIFGDSRIPIRSFGAVLSVLQIPAAACLAFELFGCSLAAFFAALIFSTSPFHQIYALTVREYSAWTLLLLLCNIALLRALRGEGRSPWILYGISMLACFYTFTTSISVAAGHAIYVAWHERLKLTRKSINFILASVIALSLFVPWMLVIASRRETISARSAWCTLPVGLEKLLSTWPLNLSHIFFDVSPNFSDSSFLWLVYALVAFEIYCFFLVKKKQPEAWKFLLTFAGISCAILVLPDLLLGGARSLVLRYSTPLIVALQMMVAFTLAYLWKKKETRFASIILTTALIGSSLLSCWIFSNSISWWSNPYNNKIPQTLLPAHSKYPDATILVNLAEFQDEAQLLVFSNVLGGNVEIMGVENSNLPEPSKLAHRRVLVFNTIDARGRSLFLERLKTLTTHRTIVQDDQSEVILLEPVSTPRQ